MTKQSCRRVISKWVTWAARRLGREY